MSIELISQGVCTSSLCVNGKCYDRIVLDDTLTVTVTADITSFVAPRHRYKPTCHCKDGYGGDKCELIVNECARNPCPQSHVCKPEANAPGYSCHCPENNPECVNSVVVSPCKDSASGGGCYEPRNPLTFSGKSYAQYTLGTFIDRHLTVSIKIRTIHPTGNIMFASGRVDYSILEIVNGQVINLISQFN